MKMRHPFVFNDPFDFVLLSYTNMGNVVLLILPNNLNDNRNISSRKRSTRDILLGRMD